jgi:putative ATP-binding cassette transporter
LLHLLLRVQALMDSGSTVISVGHRPSLISYHQEVLQLGSSQAGMPGKWQVLPAQQMQAAGAELQ